MKSIKVSLLLASIVAAGYGCSLTSPLPPAKKMDHEEQYKIQASQHWHIIAKHVASKIAKVGAAHLQPLYIDEQARRGVFGKVFGDMLTSELISSGLRVSTRSQGALTITYNVETIMHPSDRDGQYPWIGSVATGLYYLVKEMGGKALPVVAITSDVALQQASKTNTEITITTQVSDRNIIIFSETAVYYISKKSAYHYMKEKETSKGRVFDVTGS